MKSRVAIFILLPLFLSFIVWAEDSEELRIITRDISLRRQQYGNDHERTIAQLMDDANRISNLITKGRLTPQEKAGAHYYRALAWSGINALHHSDGKKTDEPLARQTLAELDKMIAAGIEYPALGATVSNALYTAGIVAKNYLRADALGYAYWRKCAALEHAGCMNIMADALLTGKGNQKVDFPQAIEYHLKVFNTGIQYRCAGAYSARSIAGIEYFTGTPAPQGDELTWLKKAYKLLDQLKSRDGDVRVCGKSDMLIDEFLYRLARGDRQEKLLDEASAVLEPDSNTSQAIIGYLSGQITPLGFSATVTHAKTEPAKCAAYFDALWYEEVTRRHDLARQHYQRMVDLGKSTCEVEILFARKFKFTPEAKADPS
jgi:hypothetical protein